MALVVPHESGWPPAPIPRRRGRAILTILISLLILAAPAFAARVALVVGNGNYTSVRGLPNPANDARAIGEKLGEIGFDVEILVDADLAAMRDALDGFAELAQGAETALIFYAGHGLQVNGANYILPTDIMLRSREDLETTALGVGELFAAFNRAAPEAAILILDACRDNPFVSTVGADQGLASGAVSSSALTSRPNAAGLVIAFAAAPGAVAYDGESGNSPYTTALLQWIGRPGLELGTMLRRVRGTVLQLTNGAQVPWVEEALVRDVFLNPAAPPPERSEQDRIEVALLERIRGLEVQNEQDAAETFYDRYIVNASLTADEAPTQDDDQFVREGLIWLSIRNSDDPEIFQAYIDEFPESVFTELARAKLEAVASTPQPQVLAWLDNLGPVQELSTANTSPTLAIVVDSRPSLASVDQLPEADAPTDQGVQLPDALPPQSSDIEAGLGLSKAELAAVQMLLREAGVYRGALDADYGPGTRGGIKRLQADVGLVATGYLDLETMRQLVARAAPAILKGDVEAARHYDIHRVAAVAARGPGAEVEVIRVEAINRNVTVHSYWREVADGFEADHPGTQIEINHRPGVRYRVELMSILGSETPPDILYTWSGGHLAALREAGFARDLTDDMADGWAFEFKPGALQTYTHDGRVHGVPMHLALVSLYANRTVLENAGISVDSLNSWFGFLRAVGRLKAQGIVPVAIGGGDRWPFNLYYGELAQRLGGKEVFEAAIAGTGAGFDGSDFLDAAERFEAFTDMQPFQPGFLEMDDGQAAEMLARGEAAMVVTGNWRLQKMRWSWPGGPVAMNRELVQLDFPSVGDRPQATLTHGGADGFAVAADAPDAAVEFLRHLTARDVQERMVEIAADMPSLSGADLSIKGGFLEAAAEKMLQSTYHQLYYDQALGPEAGGVLTEAMIQLATDEIDAATAMRRLDDAWDRILSDRASR